MNIEWNTVTWYSKALAVVLFVGVAIGAFFLGREYENVTSQISNGMLQEEGGGDVVSGNGEVTLGISETGRVGDVNLTLSSILQDSRCPVGVQCIQAGSVTAVVTLARGEKSLQLQVSSNERPIASQGVFLSMVRVEPEATVATKCGGDASAAKCLTGDIDYRITFKIVERADPDARAFIERAKNATYAIEGKEVELADGMNVRSIVDSTEKIVTTYFGNQAIGDVNGDDLPDMAFLLTQSTGGTGTFYYVAVLFTGEASYQGTNAVLIGDRIAPQTTEIRDGKIIVNYADRKEGEAMTDRPSVGKSMYLVVKNEKLVKQ